MLRRRSLMDKLKIPYTLITVDTNCTNAAQVQSWLQSKGYWETKKLHLNKCVGARPNNQLFTYSDVIYDKKRIRNGSITDFIWGSNYDLTLKIGDEYLIYDSSVDLIAQKIMHMEPLVSFNFEYDVVNCQIAKQFLDEKIYGTGVMYNTNSAIRTTKYDALTITFTDGPSTGATRYGAGNPNWGSNTYDLKTYTEDTWMLQSGNLYKKSYIPTFSDINGLNLSN